MLKSLVKGEPLNMTSMHDILKKEKQGIKLAKASKLKKAKMSKTAKGKETLKK